MTTTLAQGWLPAPVQELANLIVREELPFVPLVEDSIDDQSLSLRRMGDDAELGIIRVGAYWVSRRPAELGRDVILSLVHPEDDTQTIEIVGAPKIIAAFHRHRLTGSLYPQD